jgi:hypothetical protein
MKYLSLAMVAVLIVLSWFLIKTPADLTAEQHARLQEVLKEYLAVYLKENNPTASEIQDPQIFTRVIERGKKMQAQFKFFYTIANEEGDTNKIAREGLFLLTSENGNDWTAKMEKISDTYVEFSDALQISLTGDQAPAETPVTEPTAAPETKTDKKEKHKGH